MGNREGYLASSHTQTHTHGGWGQGENNKIKPYSNLEGKVTFGVVWARYSILANQGNSQCTFVVTWL